MATSSNSIIPEPITAAACYFTLRYHSTLTSQHLRPLLQSINNLSELFLLTARDIEGLALEIFVFNALQHAYQHRFSTDVTKALDDLEAKQITVLALSDSDYPALLKETYDPPPFLFVRGDVTLLSTPQLAMVGSRRTHQQGLDNAYRFAESLADCGFTITSGLALGIDAASHKGALAAGGQSVAVLGAGIDMIYPARNRPLYEQMTREGVIVSEYPPGTPVRKGQFPRRNRLISGLSLGVLVVEAAIQSGSLITARCALEQGREVFAIPGSIHNPASRGCHALIRQGAKLVETVEHIVEELEGWLPKTPKRPALPVLEPHEKQLLLSMGYDPVTVDDLLECSALTLPELLPLLTQLTLKGAVEDVEGYYQRLI